MARFSNLWDYNKPAETRDRFLAIRPKTPHLPELLTQIARTYGLERNFETAHRTLDEADALIDETLPIARIRSLLERGRTFNSAGKKAKACELFEAALALSEAQRNDEFAADAAHMLGIASADSLKWSLRALKIAENSADSSAKRWQGSLLNNIGWTSFSRAKYETAIDYFERCPAYYEMKNDANYALVARWAVAKSQRMMGQVDMALSAQREILAARTEAGLSAGYTHEEIGECLITLGKSAESRPHFAAAHVELSQDIWLVANESERLVRLKALATANK